MPAIICIDCGRIGYWSNHKGSKLSDLKCVCGGCFRRYTYEDQKKDYEKHVFEREMENIDRW